MVMTQNGPWEMKPNRQSVMFAGRYISLLGIARTQNIDQSYLSRVFSGERSPSLNHARKLAAALGMGLEAFLDALDDKARNREIRHQRIVSQYDARLRRESVADKAKARRGRPVIPRTPLLKV